jgi:glycyl-tRNA synthetase
MAEREHSTYYFDVADVEGARKMFVLYEQEAKRAIDAGLVLPAHDYVLKSSHAFNILDARGAVGVTERQAMFSRTRELARRVALAYVEQRQKVEFPWIVDVKTESSQAMKIASGEESFSQAPFLLEIGTEELPSSDLASAITQLDASLPTLLETLRLTHGAISVMGTPRRLVVLIEDLAAVQPDQLQLVKGPPADRAFDKDGEPTRAAEGFARSKGVEVADLEIKQMDGGAYVVARVEEKGQTARILLNTALPELIAGIRFNKSMRWNESGIAFSRPIRWLLALHGNACVPFSYADISSGQETWGLRFEEPDKLNVSSPQDYLLKMTSQGIILSPEERKTTIKTQAEALAAEVGGQIPEDLDLLTEVTHMVEKPTAFRGEFDKSYLDVLPQDVLISVMKKHQRYFVLEDAQEKLLPYFIGVRNGGADYLENVIDGNAQVILARFDDAVFFVKKDLQKSLEAFVPDLKMLTFQDKLGSLFDKTQRISRLVEALGMRLGLDQNEMTTSIRAASLCKADLATNMVVEMTSLQGVMGRYYALNSGETPAVAQAIFEHYLPRSANDHLPETKPGLVVGLADRLDSLIGLFAVGLAPTGTKDPFAQRRAALAICQNLIKWQLHFDLQWGLQEAGKGINFNVSAEDVQTCLAFIQGRLRVMLLEMGFNYDVVDAVIAEQGSDPYGAYEGVKALSAWVARSDWHEILPAFSRCVRITRDQVEIFAVDEEKFVTEYENRLYQAVVQAEVEMKPGDDVDAFLTAFLPMIPVINRFFDEVLVMDEDLALRQNRLGLLQRISRLSEGIADLSYLEGF